MHLCLLTSSYPTAPDDLALPFLPQFVGALERRRCRVTVVAPDRRPYGAGRGRERVVWFRWLGGRRPVVSLASARPRDLFVAGHLLAAGYASAALLHARDPFEHVLAAFALPSGLVGRALRLTHGVPYSVWALGSDVHVLGRRTGLRSLVSGVLSAADHRFADGYILAGAVERLAGAPCRFLPSGRLLPPPAEVPVDRARRNLLYLGRLEPVKGVDVLLEAFELVAAGCGDTDLHVVGDGSLRPRLEAAARRRLTGRLHLHAPVGAEGVAGFLATCDLLLLPSRAESVPTLLIEAAQAGLPTVASAVGDVPRVVQELGLGELVPPGDAAALADAIARWATRRPDRQPADPRRRAGEIFGPDAAAAAFLAAVARP